MCQCIGRQFVHLNVCIFQALLESEVTRAREFEQQVTSQSQSVQELEQRLVAVRVESTNQKPTNSDDIKSQLSNRIRTLETDLDDSDKVKELEVTKGQLKELQQGKRTLEDKVGELQVRAGVCSYVSL